jgi:hypothetical protein
MRKKHPADLVYRRTFVGVWKHDFANDPIEELKQQRKTLALTLYD